MVLKESPVLYRTSRAWRLFFYVMSPPIFGLMIWMMLFPWLGEGRFETGHAVLLGMTGLTFSLFLAYSIVSITKYQVHAFPDRIEVVDVFRTKVIRFADMEGFRLAETTGIDVVRFFPKQKGSKPKIYLMMAGREEFETWLQTRCPNLDAETAEKEYGALLSDPSLGADEESRLARFGKATRFAWTLDCIGFAIGIWGWFWPHPYGLAIGLLAAFPFLVCLAAGLFPGVIRFDTDKGSPYPAMATALFLPCIVLAIRGMRDWEILSYQAFWLPFAILSLLLLATVLFQFKDSRRKPVTVILLAVSCALYGYGAALAGNCLKEESAPAIYPAKVLEKRVSGGKSRTRYLKVSPWGPRSEEEDITVPRQMYEGAKIGDSVEVLVKPGRLGIPWYQVRIRDYQNR